MRPMRPEAPEERARRRRPEGWRAPGPAPAGARGRPELEPGSDEDLSFLTGDWRIFQLKKRRGHRWSLDDMLTAFVAVEEARATGRVARALDLGCGIGSVLMMVAWALPEVRALGIEAQERSAGMARRSLAYNGAEDRCEVRLGDLRDAGAVGEEAAFDLVTGTPPYLPLGRGLVSGKAQRGPCCFETRGGLEDYCLAAARSLAPAGRFVVCAGGQDPLRRATEAAARASLAIARRTEVVPREGKPTLFRVFSMVRAGPADRAGGLAQREDRFVVRGSDGAVSEQMQRALEALGWPPAGAGGPGA